MKKRGNGRIARVFELENNNPVSTEFQIIDLQRNIVTMVKDDVEYIMTSEFNIPDYCFDGELFVIFMILMEGKLYPIQFPGKTESDVVLKIPITDALKTTFFQTPKYASYFQELEQLKSDIRKNIKIIEDAVPFVQCTTEVEKPRTKYVIENKNKNKNKNINKNKIRKTKRRNNK